jgi:glutamine amidotransferase
MITILDYGLGNPESVKNMLRKLSLDAAITNNKEALLGATVLIIPGVGHFQKAMNNLREQGLIETLNEIALKKSTPVLGICLGMQLFFELSEEGNCPGLGWIEGEITRFDSKGNTLKIPHMGWSEITPQNQTELFHFSDQTPRYYFVHSYHANVKENNQSIASCFYGKDFTCAVQKNNITGVQFHPEKSHLYGMQFFRNYFDTWLNKQ